MKSYASLYTCTDSPEPSMQAYTKIAVSTMQRVELENYYE